MAVTQYIGARYVPLFAEPSEWSSASAYEPLTVVIYQGASYTSKQAVPVGIDINNESFWACTGNYNAQIEAYRTEVKTNSAQVQANADAITAETARAEAAEQANADAITAETARAEAAEQANADAIAAETARAEAAEQANADAIAAIFNPPAAINMATPVARVEVTSSTDAQGGCVLPNLHLYVIGFQDGTLRAYSTTNGAQVGSTQTTTSGNHNNCVTYNGKDTLLVCGGNANAYWIVPVTAQGLGTPVRHATTDIDPAATAPFYGVGWFDDDNYWFHFNYTDLYTIPISGGTRTKLCDIPWQSAWDGYNLQELSYDRAHKLFYLAHNNYMTVFDTTGAIVSKTDMAPIYNGCSCGELEAVTFNDVDNCYYFSANAAPVFYAYGRKSVSTVFKCRADGSADKLFVSVLASTSSENRVLIGVDYANNTAIWQNTSQYNIGVKYAQDAYCIAVENKDATGNFEIDVYNASQDFGVVTGGPVSMRCWVDSSAYLYGIFQTGGFVSYNIPNSYLAKNDWVISSGLINAYIPSQIKLENANSTTGYLINAAQSVIWQPTATSYNTGNLNNCVVMTY